MLAWILRAVRLQSFSINTTHADEGQLRDVFWCSVIAIVASCQAVALPVGAAESQYQVGSARVDITPDYPVRMNGFLVRKEESRGVRQRIWAKALAIGDDTEGPLVLITVDNLGVPDEITHEVARRIGQSSKLRQERLAIAASHTHTAPMINGCAPNIFGAQIPPADQAHIDRYTQFFTDKLVEVGLAALDDRKPATMMFGVGKVTFAKNRRSATGPIDHELPMLVVRDLNGQPRSILVNYACHCVTLSESLIGGDWAGYAQEHIERIFPGSLAMVSIGCGADQNPLLGVQGDRFDIASQQGLEIACEVKRLADGPLQTVSGKINVQYSRIDLDLAELPSRQELEQKSKLDSAIGYHARVQLSKLDRGEKLRTKIDYPIQTWQFGDSLCMVFLAGEVVVDYAKRLKSEIPRASIWVNAYSNAAPCYIPSERVLSEGGYEGGSAMIYYDQPTRFAPGLEEKILGAVKQQLAR